LKRAKKFTWGDNDAVLSTVEMQPPSCRESKRNFAVQRRKCVCARMRWCVWKKNPINAVCEECGTIICQFPHVTPILKQPHNMATLFYAHFNDVSASLLSWVEFMTIQIFLSCTGWGKKVSHFRIITKTH